MIEIVTQALITEAVEKLGGVNGSFVSLADVRRAVGASRDDFDRAANALVIKGTCWLIPEENQKTITVADVEASIFIGEPKHLITIC